MGAGKFWYAKAGHKLRAAAVTASFLACAVALPAGASQAAAAGTQGGSCPPAARGPGQNPDGSYPTSATSLGVNTNSGDARFQDAPVPGLLSGAGIGRVRYPGGSGADFFNWQNGGRTTWPQYMNVLSQAGAAPLITVNYGQTSVGGVPGPQSAADWAANALTYPGYCDSTALWVLGNEGYGAWELDQHPDPHTPQSYAANALPYMQAMHAADPHVRVGVPLVVPRDVSAGTGTWVADPSRWNQTILSQDHSQINWADFHWYPIFGIPVLSNAQIFATVQRIPGVMTYLKGLVARYDPGIPISVSESNISQSEVVYNVQPVAALYAAATSLEFLSHGASSYMWWQVHNTDNMDGDFGFLSDATGSPGPSATTLSADAAAGARNVPVASTDGFHYGHQFTIGSGSGTESHKITALPGTTTLAASAAPGDKTVNVAQASAYTTNGPDTDYAPFFAAGTPVTIGAGADAETRTVTSAGTGADSATLAAPAAAGGTNVKIVGAGMGGQSIPVFMPPGLAPGAKIAIGSGSGADTATIKSVGDASSLGTTLVAPASTGARTVYVSSVTNTSTGVANYVGDPVTVGSGGTMEVRTITNVGTGAGPATTVAAPAAAGDTTVHVASTSGFTVGHNLVLDSGGNLELARIASVGSAGASGTGVTLASPLRFAHPADAPVRDAGTGITLSAPLAKAHAVGEATRDAGTGITLTQPLRHSHGAGDSAATPGTGVTLSAPLHLPHAGGTTISSSGITFTPALSRAQASGSPLAELGLAEPAVDTPLPAYWGFTLASHLTAAGAQLSDLTSPAPSVLAYKSFQAGKSESVMLINTNDADATTVKLTGMPGSAGQRLQTYSYGLGTPTLNPGIVSGSTTAATAASGLVLPPESILVLSGPAGQTRPPVALSPGR